VIDDVFFIYHVITFFTGQTCMTFLTKEYFIDIQICIYSNCKESLIMLMVLSLLLLLLLLI